MITNNENVKTEIEERKQEYQRHNRDPKKHYVRVNGWVAVAKKRLESIKNKEKTNRKHIRYFTLCGKDAMDILLFKKHNLIFFDGRGYPDVVFCEEEHESFESIRRILKRVRMDFKGSFEDIVFQSSFINLFPFDIFNLDFTRNCFPRREQPFSTTLRSIVKIIEEQANKASDFDLFVTFRAEQSRENVEAIKQLKENMEKNFEEYDNIKKEFIQKYNNRNLSWLSDRDYSKFLLLTFPKLIVRFGNENHFNVHCSHKYEYPRIYTHRRTGRRLSYKIVKFIFSFEYIPPSWSIKRRGLRRTQILESNYKQEIENSIKIEPTDVLRELRAHPFLKEDYNKEVKELVKEIKLEEF